MRVNLPVTAHEYVLPPGEVIITRTDPEGRITYANEAFLASSGYSLEECMGQPHNLVRHPEMPPEAFADLWRTVKSGRPWTGIVRNRRKDGGFYWVRANVSPIIHDGRIQGFMSVRVRPTTEEVAAAKRLYAALREGRAKFQLRGGQVIERGVLGRMQRLRSLSASSVLTLALSPVVLFALAVCWTAATHVAHAGWRGVLFTLGLLCAAFSIGAIVFVRRRVTRPLTKLQDEAMALTGGQLDQEFTQAGAQELVGFTRLLNQMNAKLIGVLRDTTLGLEQFVEGVTRIVSGNEDLAHRTGSQAATLQEMASSLEQMTAGVQQTAENVRHAKQLAEQTSDLATQGETVMHDVTRTMEEISTSSSKVAAIVSIIEGIAFQTNILAINAAVEAARAGDQGRGFAVVASEVRTLAQRVTSSADEIKTLIAASQNSIRAGGDFTAKAGASMEEIASAIHSVTDLIGRVATATDEQSQGIAQINQAMAQIDQVTQQNAMLVDEISGAAGHLRAQSDRVLEALAVLNAEHTQIAEERRRAAENAGLTPADEHTVERRNAA